MSGLSSLSASDTTSIPVSILKIFRPIAKTIIKVMVFTVLTATINVTYTSRKLRISRGIDRIVCEQERDVI